MLPWRNHRWLPRSDGGRAALGLGVGVLFACWAFFAHPAAPGETHFAVLVMTGLLAWFAGELVGRARPGLPGVVVLGVVALLFLIGFPDSLLGSAAAPPLGYSNANAALVAAATAGVLGAARAETGNRRTALLGVAWVCTGVALLTGSIAGLLVCLLLLLVWVLVPRANTRTWWGASVALLLTTLGTTIGLALAYGSGHVPALLDRTLGAVRPKLWSDALQMVSEAPVRGVGPGNFLTLSPTAHGDPDLAWAHSAPLQVWAELGSVGLLLMVVLVLWMVWHLGRWSIVLAVVALQPMIDHVLNSVVVVAALGVTLGGLAALSSAGVGATSGREAEPMSARPREDDGRTLSTGLRSGSDTTV